MPDPLHPVLAQILPEAKLSGTVIVTVWPGFCIQPPPFGTFHLGSDGFLPWMPGHTGKGHLLTIIKLTPETTGFRLGLGESETI